MEEFTDIKQCPDAFDNNIVENEEYFEEAHYQKEKYNKLEREEKLNPWSVENIEDFLYFCCPECNERQGHIFFLTRYFHRKEHISLSLNQNALSKNEQIVFTRVHV